ncbi:MAG: GIY-YIG nuclease family protein [Candidatus Aminicenantes bacterium]|nr:MAG: GIY-YIG nuclease family protein [Candidatus Aminicenantes bacterium]
MSGKEQDNGMYVLFISLAETQKIKPGKLPAVDYKNGTYLYIGRARTGLQARIKRHLRNQKKLFWHIDYLLQKAKIVDIWIRQDYFAECKIAREIENFRPAAPKTIQGFGSSDCGCRGHLFYFPQNTKGLRALKKKIGFEKVKINGNNL